MINGMDASVTSRVARKGVKAQGDEQKSLNNVTRINEDDDSFTKIKQTRNQQRKNLESWKSFIGEADSQAENTGKQSDTTFATESTASTSILSSSLLMPSERKRVSLPPQSTLDIDTAISISHDTQPSPIPFPRRSLSHNTNDVSDFSSSRLSRDPSSIIAYWETDGAQIHQPLLPRPAKYTVSSRNSVETPLVESIRNDDSTSRNRTGASKGEFMRGKDMFDRMNASQSDERDTTDVFASSQSSSKEDTSLAKMVSALKARVSTLMQEAQETRQTIITILAERTALKEHQSELESQLKITESRLDASAERCIEMEARLFEFQNKKEPLPCENCAAFGQWLDDSHIDHRNHIDELQRELDSMREREKELVNTIKLITKERTAAEWARVGSDEHATEMETRLEHIEVQLRSSRARELTIAKENEDLRNEIKRLEAERTEMRTSLNKAEKNAFAHESRVKASEANYAAKRTMELLDNSGMADIEWLLVLVETKLKGQRVDVEAMLVYDQDEAFVSQSSRGDRETAILGRVEILTAKAKILKNLALDELAKGSAFREPQPTKRLTATAATMPNGSGGGGGTNVNVDRCAVQ